MFIGFGWIRWICHNIAIDLRSMIFIRLLVYSFVLDADNVRVLYDDLIKWTAFSTESKEWDRICVGSRSKLYCE